MSKMNLPMNLKESRVDFCGSIPCPVDGPDGPAVHFEWDEAYDFPDVGEMSVKFRVKRREERIRDNGSKHYEVVVELTELRKMKELDNSPARSFNEAEKALDELRKEMEG